VAVLRRIVLRKGDQLTISEAYY
ncbi:MAG: hypothetical protein JWN36_824, partial [Microbacteriaceae bacterium]|nr:hypothetical protein [Microbacteriaceae bacterium]